MTPDVEKVAVAWCKANAALTAVNGGRVATRLPREPWTSFIRVQLVDSTFSAEDETGTALLQFDVFATNEAQSAPAFPVASEIARTLVDELKAIAGVDAGGGHIYLARPDSLRRFDDPDVDRWARYVVDARLVIRPEMP